MDYQTDYPHLNPNPFRLLWALYDLGGRDSIPLKNNVLLKLIQSNLAPLHHLPLCQNRGGGGGGSLTNDVIMTSLRFLRTKLLICICQKLYYSYVVRGFFQSRKSRFFNALSLCLLLLFLSIKAAGFF